MPKAKNFRIEDTVMCVLRMVGWPMHILGVYRYAVKLDKNHFPGHYYTSLNYGSYARKGYTFMDLLVNAL